MTSKVLLDHDVLKFIVSIFGTETLIDEESSMVFVISCLMRDRFYSRMQHKPLQRVDDIISAF